jgi:KaiC/GvpD/RAD55 family RecA-like ATPase
MALQRVKTGIKGLDSMLKGGVPKSHHVLVAGGPGTGKTTLAVEFLYRGAKDGETCAFVSLEEKPARIIENITSTFTGWKDFKKVVKDEKLIITKAEKWNFEHLVDMIQSFVDHKGVTRIVIDSSTLLKMYFNSKLEFRRKLFELMDFLANIECTMILTAELPTSDRTKMRHGVEQFVTDGIIVLYNLEKAEKRVRAIEVLKMRGTDHARELAPMRFGSNGVEVFEGEKVY